MSFEKQFALIGALLAYLIGAGFASGQETVQFFAGWGSIWSSILVGIISFLVTYLTYSAYAYAGRTRELNNISQVFSFYVGSTLGQIFNVFAWTFNSCAYLYMVSGFGNVILQQWGLPITVGNAIAVIVSVATAITGLNKVISIIGKIGPLIIGFTLLIGIIASFQYYPLITAGNIAINSGEVSVTRAGANVILSGLCYGGVCILLVSAMVAQLGSDLRHYHYKHTKFILCVTAFSLPFVNIIMALNHMGNIGESVSSPIPNLLLANNIFGNMASIYAVTILIAIYSTLCPIMWTCASMIVHIEQGFKYKLLCAVVGICAYFITLFIPYQKLLNVIMTYCGYTGAIVFAIVFLRYNMIRFKDLKNGAQIAKRNI